MDSDLKHEDRFFSNMMDFTNYLLDLVERINKNGHDQIRPSDIQIGSVILENFDRKELIEKFIAKSHMYWDKFFEKEDEYMISNAGVIFSTLPDKYVSIFKEIFTLADREGRLIVDQDDRDIIWAFLHPFIKISINYIHNKQEPYTNTDGKRRYKERFTIRDEPVPDLNVSLHARKWGIKLFFPNPK